MSNSNQWRVRLPREGEIGGVEVYAGNEFVCQMSHHPAQRQAALNNARRIVACVNACEGIDTESLEADGYGDDWAEIARQRIALAEQCDALLAALEKAREALDDAQGNINPERGFADELEAEVSSALEAVTAAIAAAKGGAQ